MHRLRKAILVVLALLFIALLFIPFSRRERFSVLLLGAAGKNLPGGNLTDTIIQVIINPRENEVVLISIPRDIYLGELEGKINAAYVFGEARRKGEGLAFTKETIARVTGIQSDYAVKVDFTGFVKTVDLVGGLDVEVDNSFQDLGYPILGREDDTCGLPEEEVVKLATSSSRLWEVFPCRFESISFMKGAQHMDGETALKFVRSRNADGDEGTDFARSRRQQKVMVALKDKLISTDTIFNPVKLISFYNIVKANVDMDVGLSQFDDLIKIIQKMNNAKIRNIVLGYSLLVNPPVEEYGSWVLIPKAGKDNFSEIHGVIKCELEPASCPD